MPEPRHRIVVALDLSQYAEIVLEHALDQAARFAAPDLHVLYVADEATAEMDSVKQQLAALVLPALDGLDCTDWRVRLHVRAGRAADEIAELAGELAAHLIVLGRFGTHHPHRRLGSVAARVIDRAPCPTLVVGMPLDADPVVQCADCVDVRANTDGERWFCARHAGDRSWLSTMITPGLSWIGGLMW